MVPQISYQTRGGWGAKSLESEEGEKRVEEGR